jgi:S1-C subfamily serine protease
VRVRPGSAAETAGLSRGDLITAAAGAPVHSVGDLERAVRAADGSLAISVLRGVDARDVEVALS